MKIEFLVPGGNGHGRMVPKKMLVTLDHGGCVLTIVVDDDHTGCFHHFLSAVEQWAEELACRTMIFFYVYHIDPFYAFQSFQDGFI